MSARTSGWPRPPAFTTTRLTIALVVGLLLLPLVALGLAGLGGAWGAIGYLAFVCLTAWTLRGARLEPGSWLGRRAVRRGIVVAIAIACAALVAIAALPGPAAAGALTFLVLLVVLLNVALGRATRRVASAPDQAVDERQEALRNRAHRVAYWAFGVVVGVPFLVAEVASSASRSGAERALASGGAGVTFLELLFVLPAMVMAWLEPDHLAPESEAPAVDRRTGLALGMLALAALWPLALSLTVVVLPVTTTRWVAPVAVAAGDRCVEVMAASRVGIGVEARIPVHAVACADGRAAREGWGLNASDCLLSSGTMTTVTTSRCGRTTGPDGTLRFTYAATVRPSLLPFLGREVTMRVVVDRDGNVVRLG